MVIKVNKDMVECDEADIQDYVDVINGIVWDCWKNHGFERGWRNSIAVDLSVSCHMLGLDATEVLDKLIDTKIIDPKYDDEDTHRRVERCLDYKDRFCWNWMVDADTYHGIGEDHRIEAETMPVWVSID